jgi:hypothetical protein
MSSPFESGKKNPPFTKKSRHNKKFVPRKAAVQMTETARELFLRLLQSKPDRDGILLDYHQSSSGQPRMVFAFRFVTKEDLDDHDEGYVNGRVWIGLHE